MPGMHTGRYIYIYCTATCSTMPGMHTGRYIYIYCTDTSSPCLACIQEDIYIHILYFYKLTMPSMHTYTVLYYFMLHQPWHVQYTGHAGMHTRRYIHILYCYMIHHAWHAYRKIYCIYVYIYDIATCSTLPKMQTRRYIHILYWSSPYCHMLHNSLQSYRQIYAWLHILYCYI